MDKYRNVEVNRGAAAVYRLARKHGMTCRRLNWNPNYKGIDDWQIALHRKRIEKREPIKMNFKEMYLSGLCALDHIESCAERWHTLPEDGTSLRDYLGLTEQEMDVYLQTDLTTTFARLLDSPPPLCTVWCMTARFSARWSRVSTTFWNGFSPATMMFCQRAFPGGTWPCPM